MGCDLEVQESAKQMPYMFLVTNVYSFDLQFDYGAACLRLSTREMLSNA